MSGQSRLRDAITNYWECGGDWSQLDPWSRRQIGPDMRTKLESAASREDFEERVWAPIQERVSRRVTRDQLDHLEDVMSGAHPEAAAALSREQRDLEALKEMFRPSLQRYMDELRGGGDAMSRGVQMGMQAALFMQSRSRREARAALEAFMKLGGHTGQSAVQVNVGLGGGDAMAEGRRLLEVLESRRLEGGEEG